MESVTISEGIPVDGSTSLFLRMSLRRKFAILILGSLGLVFGAMTALVVYKMRTTMLTENEQAARSIAMSIANATQTFGETGDMNGLALFLKVLAERKDLERVHAMRSPQNTTEMGVRKGSEPEDEAEKQFMSTGKEMMLIDTTKNNLRFIVPINAKTSCLKCHQDAREGELLGGVSVTLKTDRAMSGIASIRDSTILVAIIALLLELGLLIWLVTRNVIQPIQTTMNSLNSGAEGLTHISTTVANSSESLSQGATEASAAIHETVSAIEEINSMMNHSVANAEQSATASKESEEVAAAGREVVQRMVSTIQEIADTNTAAMNEIREKNARVNEILTVINNIGDKTKVINDIVFQTKLLSFNASVEAARAGEQGKGFSVVAEEVGKLAQMSGSAAQEIAEIVDSSAKTVEGFVTEIQSSIDRLVGEGQARFTLGIEISKECDAVFKQIASKVASTNSMMAQIVEGSKEQSKGVEEISKAMNQLEVVTQENSSRATASNKIVTELSQNAQQLIQSVAELGTVINGAKTESTS